MARVLVLCTTHRDRRELAAWNDRHEFQFHDFASLALEDLVCEEPPDDVVLPDPLEEAERIMTRWAGQIDAVVSTDDYPGSLLGAIVSERLGLPGVPARANVACQDKFRCRELQRIHVPEAAARFQLWDGKPPAPRGPYPVFIKPVKSFFSVGAYRADSPGEALALAPRARLPEAFFESFDLLSAAYCGHGISRPTVLVESLLEGSQHTYEGLVAAGVVREIGVVDSVMFPGTLSFQRFEYPSALPAGVRRRVHEIASRLMSGIGFDWGIFNIEFMYDRSRDSIAIVEVNPRMASQFADLYEKVDGTNAYALLLDLALGKTPSIRRGKGRHAMAASCVLRTFQNAVAVEVPCANRVARLQETHPDMRIELFAERGRRLSQQMQDGRSYRYGILSIGGRDRAHILEIFARASRELPFVFSAAGAQAGVACRPKAMPLSRS